MPPSTSSNGVPSTLDTASITDPQGEMGQSVPSFYNPEKLPDGDVENVPSPGLNQRQIDPPYHHNVNQPSTDEQVNVHVKKSPPTSDGTNPLVCKFCRTRKYGTPTKEGDGKACYQCHRSWLRSSKFPTEGRRGMCGRPPTSSLTTESYSSTALVSTSEVGSNSNANETPETTAKPTSSDLDFDFDEDPVAGGPVVLVNQSLARENNDPSHTLSRTPSPERVLNNQEITVDNEPRKVSPVELPMPHEQKLPIHKQDRYQPRRELSDPPDISTITPAISLPRSLLPQARSYNAAMWASMFLDQISNVEPEMKSPTTQSRTRNLQNTQAFALSGDVAGRANLTPDMTLEPQARPAGSVTGHSFQEDLVHSTSPAYSSIDRISHLSAHVDALPPVGTGVDATNTNLVMGYHFETPTHHGKSLGGTSDRRPLSIDISQPHPLSLNFETRDLRQGFHSMGSSEDEVATRLTHKLVSVLKNSESRKALCNLQGDQAQLMVEYLYRFLHQQPSPSIPWLHKHALIALYKLSKSSLLYPHCYVLKDIETSSSQESGGAFSDILMGYHGEQHVCLKVVRLFQRSETDAVLKVYAKEAILWGQLHHPNVVPFYGIYYLNNERRQICLVSPWMKNGNLAQYLKNNPSVSRSPFVHDVTAGLEYLHRQSLIHSDLKGPNVLVNDAKIACITDFGLSSIRTDETLAYTSISTTVHGLSHHWAAPELLEDDKTATMASDVWALGCVFYEVLVGKIPFHGLSNAQVIRKLIAGATPQPLDLSDLEDIPGAVAIWALIQKCWILEAEGRPTCRTILEALISEGLTRSDGPVSTGDDMHSGRLRFEEAMKKSQEFPIDYVAVEDILGTISADGNRDTNAELQMNEPPSSPLSDRHVSPATIDSGSSSTPQLVWIDTHMSEAKRASAGTLTDIQSRQNFSSHTSGASFMTSGSGSSSSSSDEEHDDAEECDDAGDHSDVEEHDDAEAHDDDETYDDYDYEEAYDDYDYDESDD